MEDNKNKENENEWRECEKRMHNLYVKTVCKKYNVSPYPYLYPINNTPCVSKLSSDIVK